MRISIWSYADLWFRDLYRQLAILVAAPYDFGLPFGQQGGTFHTAACKLGPSAGGEYYVCQDGKVPEELLPQARPSNRSL